MSELAVTGIKVQDQTRLGGGKAVRVTHLTFYVGDHGPFEYDFIPPHNTPGEVQAYIQQKLADLRAITNRSY